MDVVPLSLGIETTGRVMSTIVKRNTPIPCRKSDTFTTEEDWQTEVHLWRPPSAVTLGHRTPRSFTLTLTSTSTPIPSSTLTFTFISSLTLIPTPLCSD